jgi:hypothetical protein
MVQISFYGELLSHTKTFNILFRPCFFLLVPAGTGTLKNRGSGAPLEKLTTNVDGHVSFSENDRIHKKIWN